MVTAAGNILIVIWTEYTYIADGHVQLEHLCKLGMLSFHRAHVVGMCYHS